jgi:hypothetical protein
MQAFALREKAERFRNLVMSTENRSGFGFSVSTSYIRNCKDEFGTGWWLFMQPDGIFFFGMKDS